jgi:hypothetical protein
MVNQKSIKKRRKKRRIIIVTSISAILITALVIIAFLSNYVGNFTISLINYETRLALSTSSDMENSTTHIAMDGFDNAVPYTKGDVDEANLDTDVGGEKSLIFDITDDQQAGLYFAYTFFVTNVGDGPCYYYYGVKINDETSGDNNELISDAMRIRMYENIFEEDETTETMTHEYLDYTRYNSETSDDTSLNADTRSYLSECEEDFASGDLKYFNDTDIIILSDNNSTKLWPNEIVRYTLVIWIDGNDPDCQGDFFDNNSGIRISTYIGSEEADV